MPKAKATTRLKATPAKVVQGTEYRKSVTLPTPNNEMKLAREARDNMGPAITVDVKRKGQRR